MPWLVPALAYVAVVGLLALTTKLALEDLRWPQLVVWTSVAYLAAAIPVAALTGERPRLGSGAGYGAISGALAATALIMLFLALDAGDVTRVIPITSSYPVVTMILAAAVLAERLTAPRIGATLMIVAGVVLLSVE